VRMFAMKTAVLLAIAVLILLTWVRVQEKRALFFPSLDLHTTPGDLGFAYEDVNFSSSGHKLNGWFLPGPDPHVVLWLHGNAGNIADRVHQAAAMNRELSVSSFLIDYRGYGKSEGRPTEDALYEDAGAAFQWLTENRGVEPSSIILYGHSLGSAVAVDLALGKGKEAGGLVMESPFTNARDMARMIYSGLPVDLLMSLKLDNTGRIGGVSMPVLVVHGVADTTIPFAMGKKVFDAAPEPKAFLPVIGGDHSDCYMVGGETYWKAWRDLLKGVQRPTSNIQR
jgi:fermentation-respiration switch protein FrsA (DUF1100 family)